MSADADTLRGWKAISTRADLSIKTARKRATIGTEHRLPVFLDHRDRPIASGSEIDQWKRDEIRPYGVKAYGAPSLHLPPIPSAEKNRRENKARATR